MEPFDKIDAKDIKLKSKDIKEFIQQLVNFTGSRIEKDKINSSLDVVNDFLRIMEPLHDEMKYWIDFFNEQKIKLTKYNAKINKLEGYQVSFDDTDENSL